MTQVIVRKEDERKTEDKRKDNRNLAAIFFNFLICLSQVSHNFVFFDEDRVNNSQDEVASHIY